VNERNSDNWEKGFDLNTLPDVELLDTQESDPVPAASPPPLEPTEPEPRPEPLPAREIDPRRDPFAGWVSGHPRADGDARRVAAVEHPRTPPFATVAAGEDPFAGRFAPADEAVVENEGGIDAVGRDEAQDAVEAETGEISDGESVGPAGDTKVMSAGAVGADAHAASVGKGSMVQGALPVRTAAAAATDSEPETPRRRHLAEVVPIHSGRPNPELEGDGEASGGDRADAPAMQAFLEGLSDEELDRAVELFERQVRQSGDAKSGDGDEDFPADLLEPLCEILETAVGEVELIYRIEEIEDIIDARLPDAARRDANWWSNRAGRSDLGHAAAWVGTGWWSYPDLDSGRVRFRRPV